MERCVICQCETDVLRSTPIDFRFDYVEGVGQLCHDCATKLRS